MQRKLFLIKVFITTCTFFLSSTISNAQTDIVLFEDNFSAGHNSWTPIHITGENTSDKWLIKDDMYGMRIESKDTSGNSVAGEESWSNYIFELEMIGRAGTDKNFIFRHSQNPLNPELAFTYEVHSSGDFIYLGKTYYPPQFLPAPVRYRLENNTRYFWKTVLKDNNIQIFIRKEGDTSNTQLFNFTDLFDPYLKGQIGVRVSTGSVYPTEVYFDNVKVTDLSSKPTLIDVPHFSQRDSGWNEEEYDHASAFQSKQNATINNWGCALTSGAMILDYYGYHLSPGGLPTNPSTLNTFLNANNGYTKSGAVIWNYLSTYAKQSKKAHEQYHALPNLELSYRAYNSGAISQGIEAKTPSIIKIITNDKQTPAINDDSMHFVVAKDIQDGDFIINDPWQLQFLPSHTLASLYPQKEYRSYIQFTPKQSDLSYITAIWYDSSVNAVMEHNGKEFGYDMNDDFHQTLENAAIETQSGLANSKSPLENLTSPQENTFHLQQPDKGLYVLNFSSENDRELEYDIRAFNSSGEDATNTQKTMVGSRKPVYIELLFDPQAEEAFATIEEVSFEALKRKVLEYEAAGDIQRHQTSKQIIQAIELAEKHFDSKANARHLDLLQEKLTGNVWKKFISDNVKAELLQMTQKLGSYLKNN